MQQKSTAPASNKMLLEFGTSGTAVCTATFATNPIDVVKVRVQLASNHSTNPGLFGTASSILRNEVIGSAGVSALFKGVSPAMARGLTYGGLRIGLYTPIKSQLSGEGGSLSWTSKILAGCLSGTIAASVTNPIELVKTRLQAADCPAAANPLTVTRDIIKKEGMSGLWRGTSPAAARAALLTASQCVTYDVVKQTIRHYTGADDSLPVQILTGAITGVVTTTVTAPADVLKTIMFAGGSGGVLDAATKLVAEEGVGALFKGWMANYVRLGPQTMIIFLVSEQLRKAFGLSSL